MARGKLCFALILSFFLVQICSAQEVKFDLGEVVVTATKTEYPVISLPTGVEIITEEDIKNSTAQSVSELLKYLPGVTVHDSYGYGIEPTVILRGFDSEVYTLVMVDGMPFNTLSSGQQYIDLIPLSNIERIEIIKGPASALWGGNACGGVINIITKDAEPKLKAGIKVTVGPDRMRHFRYFIQSPFPEKIGFIFSGENKKGDGFREHSSYTTGSYLLKLQRKTEDYNASLTLSSSEKEQEYPSWIKEKEWEAGEIHKAPYAWCNGKRRVNYIKAKFEKFLGEDSKITPYFHFYNRKYNYLYYKYDPDRRDITDEKRYDFGLQYEKGISNHSLIAGIEMSNGNIDQNYKKVTDEIIRKVDTDVNKYAVYMQDLWKISEKWEIHLGLRYDYVKFDNTGYKGAISDESTMEDWSPKFGITYKATDNVSIYSSFGRAFKPPNTYAMYMSMYRNPDLKAETATNYELGIKSIFENFAFNLSAFVTDVENLIQLDEDKKKYENVGEVWQEGIEMEASYRIKKGLIATLGADWIKAKIEKYPSEPSYEGNYLRYVPKWKASLGLQYNHDSGFFCSISGRWIGPYYMHNNNATKYEGHNVWDLKLGYEKSLKKCDLMWTLSINNIFDTKYAEKAYASAGGTKKYYPGPPRTVMTTISIKF